MSPAHVIEPTYAAIKQRLMTGAWAAGSRLESARLADDLGVSVTPVRDSLYRLAGERMVDFAHGEGFRVHCVTETEFRDMLELNLVMLLAAIAIGPVAGSVSPPPAAGFPDRLASLFLNVARRSGNGELVAAISALNDRLHLPRRLDTEILGEIEPEISVLEAIFGGAGENGEARRLVMRHHERRAREAIAYARLLAGGTE